MSNRLKFAWLPEETATGRQNAGPPGGARRFLRAYAAQLRGRRRALLAIVAGAWCAATAVMLALPVSYTGVATVMISLRPDPPLEGDLTDEVAARTIESEMEIIRSRGLAERVMHRLGPYKDADLNPVMGDGEDGFIAATIRSLFNPVGGLDGLTETERDERVRHIAISRFLERLDVSRRGRSQVVEISYRSHSPEGAASAVNALAEAYVAARTDANIVATRRASESTSRRLAELREKVEASERAVEGVRRRAGAAEQSAQALRVRQLEELRAELAELRTKRSQAEARLDRAEAVRRNADERALAAVLSSPKLRSLREEDASLRRRAMEIAAGADGQDPGLIEVKRELQRIKDDMRAENDRVMQGLRNRINVALARENAIRFALEGIENETPAQNPASAQVAALQQEAETHRAQYAALLTRFKEGRARTAPGQPEARILSAADVPLGRSPFHTIASLGFALVLACAAGLASAGIAVRFDRGFRSLQQIEEETGMPTLGLVPRIPKRGRRGTNPPDYILENPVSAYSEAIRSLYTGILLSNVDAPPTLLMVASAAPNEGKTSLALSFARMVGRIGQKKVVLVDCDTRHPQVHHELGLEASPGLVEYLAGEASLEQVLQVDEKTNALVIAAGRKPSNSVELLTSDRFADLLSKLSAACDLVILDSSPVLAISDARILARLVDKTIFVARWAKTRRELVLRGIKNLTDAGADLAGIALTQVDVGRHARFGFGDSGMYHGAYRKYYSG